MRISTAIASLLVCFAGICLPTGACGQNGDPLAIEDVLSSREFGQLTKPVWSPDQEWLVYAVKDKRREPEALRDDAKKSLIFAYSRNSDLYAVNIHTDETKNLTGGVGNNGSPAWSPDGQYLAFLSDRDGSGIAKLWLWQRSTGSTKKISDIYIRATELQWLNNREILVTVAPENSNPAFSGESRNKLTDAIEAPPNLQQSTVTLYRSDASSSKGGGTKSAPWSLDVYRSDLAVIGIETGELRRLTRDKRLGTYAVSPDASRIAFSSPIRFERPGSQQILWALSVVSVATGKIQSLASDIRLEYDGSPFSWSPDNSRLVFLTGGPIEHNKKGDCYLVDLKEQGPKNLSHFNSSPGREKQRAPLWDATGESIYFIRDGAVWRVQDGKPAQKLPGIKDRRVAEITADKNAQIWSQNPASMVVLTYDTFAKQSGFYRVALKNGESTRLLENGGSFHFINAEDHVYVVSGGNRLAYFAEDASHDRDLWMADANFQSVRRLTHLNPQLNKYKLGEAQLVEWHSLDGALLKGALLLPPGYRKGVRYPLVVWVYSGDRGSEFVNRFGLADAGPFNLQLLATRGYAVLFPDIPEDPVAPMLNIAKCVLPGINHLIKAGVVDPDRIGVIGQSYGGYSALALITQTKRFKAAVEIDGAGNLIGVYGEMDKSGAAFGVSELEQGQGRMGGTPWQHRERYIENSPYFYLDRVETPVLIVQGAEDTTTAPFLADELFVALRRLGKEVEYAKYEGEGHSAVYWKYSNQADYCRRMLSWFNRHLDVDDQK